MHDVVHFQTGKAVAFLKQTAQVAIGKYAFQTAFGIGYRQHAQAFFTHADNGLFQRRAQQNGWQGFVFVHDVRHAQQQAFAQAAGRMA